MSKIADAEIVAAIQHTLTVAYGERPIGSQRASAWRRLSFDRISRAVAAEQLGTRKEKRLKGAPHRRRLPAASSGGGRVSRATRRRFLGIEDGGLQSRPGHNISWMCKIIRDNRYLP
jgi:hypothetical protein